MPQTIRARFDGKVFVPDGPVDVPRDAAVELTVAEVAGSEAGSNGEASDASPGRSESSEEADAQREAWLATLPPLTRAAVGLIKLPPGKTIRQLRDEALAERYGL